MNRQSLITILLIVLMSMTGAKTFAHDIAAANNDGVTIYYKWANNKTELAVSYGGSSYSYYSNEYSGNVVIPETVVYDGNTYSVTSIGNDAFRECSGLSSVTIPNSITSIGSLAFYYCYGLTSVTIPNSVTSIGDYAFKYCIGLTSVTIPNSVTSIGNNAFEGCRSLVSVTVNCSPTTIGSKTFYSCTKIEEVSFDCETVTSIFIGCSSIKKATLSENVKTIGEDAFYGCSGLTSVTIPNSVISIGNHAFDGCSGLISVTIPNSVTSISQYAFAYCSGLKSVTIPNSVTSIGQYAFDGCSGLTSVTIPNSVTSIGSSTFSGCSGLTSVTIPNSVTSIGSSTFSGCSGLTSVTIPNSVTSIGQSAFWGCSNLTSVIFGSGVLSIESTAFWGTNLKKTIWLTNTPPSGYNNFSSKVNYVSNDQFNISNKIVYKFLSSNFVVDGIRYVPVSPSDRTCDAIDCIYDESAENINIAETVTNKSVTLTVLKVNPYTCYGNKYVKDLNLSLSAEIGDYAFYGCGNLESVELGQNIPSIGSSAFSGCSKLKSVVIPDAVTSLGEYAFSDCVAMESAIIGNGIETINQYTFSSCSSLKEIIIGSKVKNINDRAFSSCSSLPALTIPQAVTTIGDDAFSNCTSLANVKIADSETTLTLGSNGSSPIFSPCPLNYVYIGRDISYQTGSNYGYSPFYRNTSLRAVKITDSETEISENEFYGCTNLQQVEIGDGVTTIGNWAFSGCSSLKYFAFGSQMETIGQEAFSDCVAIEEIISKAQTPPVCGSQALEDINIFECKLYVPDGCMAAYEEADQWKNFFFKEEGEGTLPQGGDNPDGPKKCETPTITVDGSSVKFDCNTSGVMFHYTITSSDTKSDVTYSGFEVKNSYTISVYASKEGYVDSDVAKSTFEIGRSGVFGDLTGDGIVNVADHVKLSSIIMNQDAQ